MNLRKQVHVRPEAAPPICRRVRLCVFVRVRVHVCEREVV